MARPDSRPKVGEILVRAGLIDEMQLRAALGDQRSWGQPLGSTLVKMGVIEEGDLVRALAQQLELPLVDLEGKRVQAEVLELVPAEFAEKHQCVPLFVREPGGVRTLYLGMHDPCNVEVLDDLSFRIGMKVQPVLVAPSGLAEAIDRFYRRGVIALDAPVRAGVDAMPEVHESLFRSLSSESDPGASGTLELREEAPAEPAPPVAEASRPVEPDAPPHEGDAASATILRALCQLLVEKGVIERDELARLVRETASRDSS